MSKSIKKDTAGSKDEQNAKSFLMSPMVKKEVFGSNGPDLSNFKFKKKPHIKIEFDDNNPTAKKVGITRKMRFISISKKDNLLGFNKLLNMSILVLTQSK